MHLIQHTNQAKRHSIALQLDMASSKLVALLFAFAMAAAALHPSEAARLQVVQQASKPVAASQEAAEKVADQAAAGAGGVARPSTTPPLPGIPAGLPPNLLAAIPELLFPGLGAARRDSAHAAWRARPAALPPIGFSHIRTQPVPSLPDDDELADIAPELQALCEQLRPKNWRKAYNHAVTELAGEPDLGSWVGGYAQWLQGAYPTGTFWLQFDSTEDFAWGDSGLLYFCVDGHDPRTISFQLQSC